ncbi:hypothetical protein C0J52_12236 [Blattella germanica]|nr:hypothetical protein C0J52_12236 [Blattella germanica]
MAASPSLSNSFLELNLDTLKGYVPLRWYLHMTQCKVIEATFNRNGLRKCRKLIPPFIISGLRRSISERPSISPKFSMELPISSSSSHNSGFYGT